MNTNKQDGGIINTANILQLGLTSVPGVRVAPGVTKAIKGTVDHLDLIFGTKGLDQNEVEFKETAKKIALHGNVDESIFTGVANPVEHEDYSEEDRISSDALSDYLRRIRN